MPMDSRFDEDLCLDWEFALTDSLSLPSPDTAFSPVTLPHDWSITYPLSEDAPSCGSGGYARTGIGWYRKRLQIECAADEKLCLCFEGVYMNATVFLDGQEVLTHHYGYTPFSLPLLGGEKEVLVRVDNSHQPNSRWYSGSGITRPVHLLHLPAVHLPLLGVYATQRQTDTGAEITIHVEDAGLSTDLHLETELLDRDTCVATGEGPVSPEGLESTHTLSLASPALWDTEHPHLYTCRVSLLLGDTVLDTVTFPIGIRFIAYTPSLGFLLNGQKVILRGVCLHHDGGCVGAAVPPAIWERRLMRLKEMGCNALRMSHNPPDPALLDLADRMGFLVMDEAFDEWAATKPKEAGSNTHHSRGYSEFYRDAWEEDLTAMIRRDRNHPCVIMYSIGNEVFEQVLPGGADLARKMAETCHRLDPTRPVTSACDQEKAEPRSTGDDFLSALDIVGVNYPDRWRERTETFFMEEKLEHPERIYLGTEDVSVGGPREDFRIDPPESIWGPTAYYARMLKAEKLWKFVRTRPWMVGDFMWTGVDYLGECFWPRRGSDAGVLDTCAYPKSGYYFYQSQWVKDRPVLFLAPHLNLPYAEGTIYPLVVYTNCFSVELFVDGKSYGTKAYEFPFQGMTQHWGHFDRPLAPITTSDLHLTWDVPYTRGEIVAVGRDSEGNEIARETLRPNGTPAGFVLSGAPSTLPADGRSVALIDLCLTDEKGQLVRDHDLPFTVHVENGTLLGLDSGNLADLTPYPENTRTTYGGRLLAVVRAPRTPGKMEITFETESLGRQCVTTVIH